MTEFKISITEAQKNNMIEEIAYCIDKANNRSKYAIGKINGTFNTLSALGLEGLYYELRDKAEELARDGKLKQIL